MCWQRWVMNLEMEETAHRLVYFAISLFLLLIFIICFILRLRQHLSSFNFEKKKLLKGVENNKVT